MTLIPVTLNLPEDLVAKAEQAGILNESRIEAWLIEELEREKKLDVFFDTLDKLSALEPHMTQEEINAEIEAYRRESRSK